MKIFKEKISLSGIRFVIFFILFYLYVWLVIDPRILYNGHNMMSFPDFLRGMEFFNEFLTYPGGIIEYVSAFLSQLFYFPYHGALIITTIAILLCFVTKKIIASLGSIRFSTIIYVPAILFLMIYNQYLHFLPAGLGLLVSLFVLWIYLCTARHGILLRLIVFLASSIILYYIAGGVFLIYALLCGIFELLTKKEILLGLSYIFSALFIPYAAGNYIFVISNIDAYTRLLPFYEESYSRGIAITWGFYIFFPVVAVWGAKKRLLSNIFKNRSNSKKQSLSNAKKPQSGRKLLESYQRNKMQFIIESTALYIITALIAFLSLNSGVKTLLQINSFASQKKWEDVLVEARKSPSYINKPYVDFIIHDVNKALYHTGRLPYDMFTYPQNSQALITLGGASQNHSFIWLLKQSEIFLQLGFINEAEHLAHESFELLGYNPSNLYQLALINIVKGQNKTARAFLNTMSKDLVWEKLAKSRLRNLDENPSMSDDDEVQNIRSIMLLKDNVGGYSYENILENLIVNKNNRMAFEYLMAYYLLNYRLEEFVQHIKYLDDFGYHDIPTHYEEAILIYSNMTKEEIDLHGRKISMKTVKNFQSISRILNLYKRDLRVALDTIARNFGYNYFYYYFLLLISIGAR